VLHSVLGLNAGDAAETSMVGIMLGVVSLLVMRWLSRAQRRTGDELASRSAVADCDQTLLCA